MKKERSTNVESKSEVNNIIFLKPLILLTKKLISGLKSELSDLNFSEASGLEVDMSGLSREEVRELIKNI